MKTVTFCLMGADISCEILITDGSDPRRLVLCTDRCSCNELSAELSDHQTVHITVTPTAHCEEPDPFAPTSHGFDGFMRSALHHAALLTRDRLLLRVGREYTLTDLQKGERLLLSFHAFVSEPIRLLRLMESTPVVYSFLELNREKGATQTVRAIPVNREDLFLVERVAMLKKFGLKMIFSYPFRMGRMKRLTRERRLLRTLKKYGRMSEEERKKHLQSSLKLL